MVSTATKGRKSRKSKEKENDTDIIKKMLELRDRGRQLGLRDEEIYQSFTSPPSDQHSASGSSRYISKIKSFWRNQTTLRKTFFILLFCIMVVNCYHLQDILRSKCLIETNRLDIIVGELRRPLFPCQVCENLTHVPVVSNISAEDFAKFYAYSGVPLLVKGASANWSAVDKFSYHYLKKLYLDKPGSLQDIDNACQFFYFNTEFQSLIEVFNMSDERATFKSGGENWYIGWSDCIGEAGIRDHYERPYFLPNDSDNIGTPDWIFMGGPGQGAGIHIDTVNFPSWQAQLSGTKTWTLLPSPECAAICHQLNVTVEKGDIFFVDTNVWYHGTYIHPGNLSITVGAEYN